MRPLIDILGDLSEERRESYRAGGIELLLQGFRIRDMADRLSIAESTVKGHLTQVYNKLGISGRDELLRLFQEEQVRSRGFNAYVFGLVGRLLNVSVDAEEPPEPRSS